MHHFSLRRRGRRREGAGARPTSASAGGFAEEDVLAVGMFESDDVTSHAVESSGCLIVASLNGAQS